MRGYRAVGLADIENLYGQVCFHALCKARGLAPLTGVELRPGFDGRRNFGAAQGRIVLLARHVPDMATCAGSSARRGAPHETEGSTNVLASVAECAQGLFALSDDPDVLETLAATSGFDRSEPAPNARPRAVLTPGNLYPRVVGRLRQHFRRCPRRSTPSSTRPPSTRSIAGVPRPPSRASGVIGRRCRAVSASGWSGIKPWCACSTSCGTSPCIYPHTRCRCSERKRHAMDASPSPQRVPVRR